MQAKPSTEIEVFIDVNMKPLKSQRLKRLGLAEQNIFRDFTVGTLMSPEEDADKPFIKIDKALIKLTTRQGLNIDGTKKWVFGA